MEQCAARYAAASTAAAASQDPTTCMGLAATALASTTNRDEPLSRLRPHWLCINNRHATCLVRLLPEPVQIVHAVATKE